ncbi:MAG: T9SS type A sorting domain-containing protein [Bacteroidales bacterium]|nr:T9SS type A sorting domain-containing protein [Bacteroidales bacterium]
MKKILLIAVLALGFFALQAQNALKVSGTPKLAKGLQVQKLNLDYEPSLNYPYNPYNNYTSAKGIQSITKVELGSSANPYSILLSEQKCLAYNPELDLIMFTHRQNHTNPGNSGYIQSTFSSDGGLNWDYNILYADAAKLGRYPSGGIYNPMGNTQINNAYAVAAGPYTGGSGWLGNFFATIKFDSTAGNQQQIDDANATYTNLARSFLNVDSEGRVRVYGEKNTDDGTYYTGYNTAIYTGIPNAGTWAWTESNIIPDFTVGTSGNPDGYRTPGMAWSKDGETGYMVYVGRNVNAVDPNAYHPMIYKTVDAGVTWTLQPAFDWNTIPAIQNELTPTNDDPNTSRAIFSLISDAIVDANGYLHFATYVNSAFSTHPDSLGYYFAWTSIQGLMYHCYQTSTGWNADIIDIQFGQDVEDTDSPIAVAWENRLQLSKTPDEQKIVFAWTDTDTLFSELNLFPDVWTQVYNISNGERTASTNLTAGSVYDADNFFMFLSNWSGYNAATNEVLLHLTTSEFGATDLDPVYHYYLQGASIVAGVNEPVAQNNNLSFVSQNYPNPFSGSTSIDITLSNASDVNIQIVNMLGQKVSDATSNLTAGTHTISLTAENLEPGIYFYTVRAGENTVTNKMIVR